MGFVKLQLVAKFQKIEGGTLWSHLKKFEKILKLRFLTSVTVPKIVKGDPLGFFDIHCVAKYNPSEKHQRGGGWFPMLSRFWASMFLFWTRFWRFEYVLEVRS